MKCQYIAGQSTNNGYILFFFNLKLLFNNSSWNLKRSFKHLKYTNKNENEGHMKGHLLTLVDVRQKIANFVYPIY